MDINPVSLGIYQTRSQSNTTPITYESFSGADISAQIILPNEKKPLVLGELQTISYSIHRENKPVRIMGKVNPTGFVKGPRTIAGSLIFTTFNNYAFYRLDQYKNLVYGTTNYTSLAPNPMFPLADMLPPFDIIITFVNEYGSFARSKILGATIVDEGGTMSIDDLVTESTFTFMARGLQPMTAYVPETLTLETPQNLTNRNSAINTIGFG